MKLLTLSTCYALLNLFESISSDNDSIVWNESNFDKNIPLIYER